MNFLKASKKIPLRGFSRSFTSGKELVLIDVNEKNGYAKISLNKPPVNSLTPEFFGSIVEAFYGVEKNNCRGVILTSTSKNVFCAGLDITNLNGGSRESVSAMWSGAQDCFLQIYGSKMPVAAAINGHAPAGGCFLSLLCDYRVMLPKFLIGLNESKLGITVPNMLISCMRNVLAKRQVEDSLLEGRLFTSEEALAMGLIDEIAESMEEAVEKCEKYLDRFKDLPFEARGRTKLHLRAADLENLKINRQAELDGFVNNILEATTQDFLRDYMKNLKKRK